MTNYPKWATATLAFFLLAALLAQSPPGTALVHIISTGKIQMDSGSTILFTRVTSSANLLTWATAGSTYGSTSGFAVGGFSDGNVGLGCGTSSGTMAECLQINPSTLAVYLPGNLNIAGSYSQNGTVVIDGSRNLQNIGAINAIGTITSTAGGISVSGGITAGLGGGSSGKAVCINASNQLYKASATTCP